MKFSCSVEIELPRSRVIELFDNPDNMRHWQDGFLSFTTLSGEPGKAGTTSKVRYKTVELTETIIENQLPLSLLCSYEGSWGKNMMHNYFEELSPNKTLWRSDLDYVEMKGFMMRIMKTLMPSMFRKQTQKWMDQFKVFAESQ